MKYSEGKEYKTVALCMAKFNGSDQQDFIKSFYKVCSCRNIKLQIFSTLTDFYFENYTDAGEEEIFELMEPDKFDAVLIYTATFKKDEVAERIAKRVLKAGTPCISLVSPIEGCVNLTYNFEDAFEEVVRHIVEFHRPKHINFIAGMKNNSFSDERLAVFKKVLTENNIPIEEDRIEWGDFWEGPTDIAVQKFLDSGKPIDAIICANDFMAMETCRQLEKAGFKVPEDIIVSGFDGVDIEQFHSPRLATSKQDIEEFAETLGTLIYDVSDGYPVEDRYEVGCKFRVGQSCGCHKMQATREAIFKLGSEYYNVNHHERAIMAHVESLYEKIPALGNEEHLNDIWGNILHFVRDYVGGDFTVVLNNDFIGEDMEIWPNVRPMAASEMHHYYTDKLFVPFEYRSLEFKTGQEIRKINLIPNLSEYFDKGYILMFLPLHIQGSTVGYAVQGFLPENFEYFMLYSIIMNLRHVLEMHKYRIDQQNLYSTDLLTKLLNRKGFYRHMDSWIAQAIKDGKEMAVISIDMNWLKQINDTYGHKEGDYALARIATTLEAAVGNKGVTTRFGGDEFAAAIVSDNADEDARKIIENINKKLESFNKSGSKPYPLTISCGYFVHVPDAKNYQLERYIVEADRLMYADKAKFKETHQWEGNKEA